MLFLEHEELLLSNLRFVEFDTGNRFSNNVLKI